MGRFLFSQLQALVIERMSGWLLLDYLRLFSVRLTLQMHVLSTSMSSLNSSRILFHSSPHLPLFAIFEQETTV